MKDSELFVIAHENLIAGRWSSLRSLKEPDISDHPSRAKLALYIASSWLQCSDLDNVKFFILLALDWGATKHLASQFLIAGIHNTLGCAKAINTENANPFPSFEQAVNIEGLSSLNNITLAEIRMREQLSPQKINSLFFYHPFLGKESSLENNSAVYLDKLHDSKPEHEKHQLIVLGMHRSGTSCITNLLRNMGAYFGADSISTGQNQENPKGFWERRDMRQITDKLLFSIDADWCKVENFDIDRIPKSVERSAILDFNHILEDLNQNSAWVLKEPRLCLLLPLLREQLSNPIAVCVYREPIEVALSLQKRNGFTLTFGLFLWEYYTKQMLTNTSDLNRIFISYNTLINQSSQGIDDIHKALNSLGIILKKPNKAKIPRLIDSSLHRNKATSDKTNGLMTINQYNLHKYIQSQSVHRSLPFPLN